MKNKSLLVDAKNYTKEHIKKQNWLKVVTVLASIVVFVTTYALIIPAITMEKTLICDIEEHEHTKECYDEKGELTCKKREHIHTESCYDAPNGKIVYTIESEPTSDGTFAVISGNIPKNAIAKIEPLDLTKNEVREYLDSKTKDKLIEYVAYDIKIYVNDEEWQPDEYVNVVIKKANIQLNEDESINVAHVDDKTDEISQMPVEMDKSGDIIFETNGFSTYIIYTVEFEYNDYHYSIFGGSEIKLSRLLKLLGVDIEIDNVKSVEFSNEDLISIKKYNDDWNIVTLHHFSTDELLTIELKNNGKIIINVTDDYTEVPQDGEWYLVKTPASELQPGDQVLILNKDETVLLYSSIDTSYGGKPDSAWADPFNIETLYSEEGYGTITPFQFDGKTYYNYNTNMQQIMTDYPYLVTISNGMGIMNGNGKYLNLAFDPYNGNLTAYKTSAAGSINDDGTISAIINGNTTYLTYNPNADDSLYGFIPRTANDSNYGVQYAQFVFYRLEKYVAPAPEEPEGPTPQEGEYYLVETPASKLKPGDQVIVANGTENHIIWSQNDSVYADGFSFLFYDGASYYPVDPILYNGAKYYLYPGIIEQSVEYNDYFLTVSGDMGLMNCNSKYLNLSSNNISFQNTSAAKINSNNTISYTSGGSSYYLTNSDSDEYFTRSTNANNSQLVFYKLERYTTSGQEEPDDPVQEFSFKVTKDVVGISTNEKFQFLATINDGRFVEDDSYTILSNGSVEFELGDDDNILLKVTEGSTVTISELNSDGYYTKFIDDSRNYQKISTTYSFVINTDNNEITVVNTPGVKLPATGGKGITFVYKIGIFLVVSSMICYFIAKKRLKK